MRFHVYVCIILHGIFYDRTLCSELQVVCITASFYVFSIFLCFDSTVGTWRLQNSALVALSYFWLSIAASAAFSTRFLSQIFISCIFAILCRIFFTHIFLPCKIVPHFHVSFFRPLHFRLCRVLSFSWPHFQLPQTDFTDDWQKNLVFFYFSAAYLVQCFCWLCR